MKHHGFSLNDIEEMLPWERDIYVALIKEWIEEEKERLKRKSGGF
jgi:hypothetical protein